MLGCVECLWRAVPRMRMPCVTRAASQASTGTAARASLTASGEPAAPAAPARDQLEADVRVRGWVTGRPTSLRVLRPSGGELRCK